MPYSTNFVKALESIHGAGILHGNLKGHNLVIRNNIKLPSEKQGVAIVGFGDAVPKSSKNKKADELKRLMVLLPSPLKHGEDGSRTLSFVDVYPEAALQSRSAVQPSPDLPRAKRRNITGS